MLGADGGRVKKSDLASDAFVVYQGWWLMNVEAGALSFSYKSKKHFEITQASPK